MSVNGDVSEQVVRLSLEGFEVLAKLTGSGAKNVAAMIYTIMKDKKQTKGKTKLNNMLRAGKPLKIFTIKKEDLKTFAKASKSYGISYCALVDKKNEELDGMADIMVKEEDASRINRIVERFKLTTIDTARVETQVTNSLESKELERKEKGLPEKSKEEQLADVLKEKSTPKEQVTQENFKEAKTEKSPLLEPSLMNSKTQEKGAKVKKRPSVRKELAKLKIEAKILDEKKTKEKAISKQINKGKNKTNKKIKTNR
ncbi:MAG: PcfB family protein [Clostridia bacterium]|nr:PcfB family protein [Clostridia bacterium]